VRAETEVKKPHGLLFPEIDPNRCEGKGPCIQVCPVGVFTMGVLAKEKRYALTLKGKVKGMMHRWQQAGVTQPNVCEACGLCVTACPEQAIHLKKARSNLDDDSFALT
jgi:4Fe-4S ferredoxin